MVTDDYLCCYYGIDMPVERKMSHTTLPKGGLLDPPVMGKVRGAQGCPAEVLEGAGTNLGFYCLARFRLDLDRAYKFIMNSPGAHSEARFDDRPRPATRLEKSGGKKRSKRNVRMMRLYESSGMSGKE
jgi:hypothetical protein